MGFFFQNIDRFRRIAERSTWRWVFWSTSIIDVIIQLSGLFYLRESAFN